MLKHLVRAGFVAAAIATICLASPPTAEAAYTCRPGLPNLLCQWAIKCDADGHSVWERQFGKWACIDNKGAMKRKECKEQAEAAKASGVIDFHHFANGNTCYFIYSKN